jgi:septal ring factor EnvC (AmiA/AmiB activator)
MTPHRLLTAALLLAYIGCATSQPSEQPKYSTRAEFRSCLLESDGLKEQADSLTAKMRSHEAELMRSQDQIRAHVATQYRLDATDEAAVKAFNKKVVELNERVEELNLQADKLNKEQIGYNKLITASNERCAGMVVTSTDYDAVKRERAAQGKKL